MAPNVQCLQKYRKRYDDHLSVHKYLHHWRFCFHKNCRVNKSFSFFLIYFRYVDVVLMRDFRNKRVNIAERIQTYQIRKADTNCLTIPADLQALMMISFPSFVVIWLYNSSNHSAWGGFNLVSSSLTSISSMDFLPLICVVISDIYQWLNLLLQYCFA